MKTLLGTRKYLLIIPVLVACGLIISYGQGQKKGSTEGEGYAQKGIVLHLPLKLSEKDEKDLIKKLEKFDKSLYKLEKVNAGQVQTTWGEMKLAQELEAEMTDAKAKGMSVFDVNFTPVVGVAGAGSNHLLRSQSKELIQAISPILNKYQ